jgi:hypothetical protein
MLIHLTHSAGPQTFYHLIHFMFEGRVYTISESDCESNAGVWSSNNGGSCTVNVTPELCATSRGTWHTENSGSCTVDPGNEHVMGTFVDMLTAPSNNVTARHLTRSLNEADMKVAIKGYSNNIMLGAVLGLAVSAILVLLAKSVQTAWGRRARTTRCVLVSGDVEGGYKDAKLEPEQKRMRMQ